jgi:hypothetical protein
MTAMIVMVVQKAQGQLQFYVYEYYHFRRASSWISEVVTGRLLDFAHILPGGQRCVAPLTYLCSLERFLLWR